MSNIALPNIKCYVTRVGETVPKDLSAYFAYNEDGASNSITQNFGRQGDTGTFTLVDPFYSKQINGVTVVSPSFVVPTFSRVKVVDQSIAALTDAWKYNYGVLFQGYVSNPTLMITSPTKAIWHLTVMDYTGYMNASIVHGQYEGLKMEDLVVLLVKMADCGIKAETTAKGGYVSPGPVIPRLVFTYQTLADALKKVSRMASSSSAYGWYVDDDLNLHFYDQQQAPSSGITVTDTPTTGISFTECHIANDGSLKYELDGQSVFNRAVVVGSTTTIRPKPPINPVTGRTEKHSGPPTDRWRSTGAQASFPMSFVPDVKADTPLLLVNSNQLGISFNDGSAVPTTPWMIVQAPNGTWTVQVNAAAKGKVPPAGSIIEIWYPHQTTITATANDHPSQLKIGGPNKGVFATPINQRSINTVSGAYARAKREVAEYGRPQERISFTTTSEFIGTWRAGQTFQLNSSLLLNTQKGFTPPLNARFVITQSSLSITDQGFRTWSIQAVRVK